MPEIPTQDRPILTVRNATRRFSNVTALERVSLDVRKGEFVTLLGPSGSGKTTLLRIIAGLEQPTEIDELNISGLDVRGIPANHRNVATVFQHYGLFPHMTVGENIEYGLRVRKRPPEERRRRAMEALELVRLSDKYGRRIHQLSGGERQRIALARAIVTEPEILLLDEPLGALDERLRHDMQVELLQLQRTLGTTFILVTHSQEEALTMSARIVLLNKGHIVQDGTPQDLFERPHSRFVARFIGIENVLDARVIALDGENVRIETNGVEHSGRLVPGFTPSIGESVFAAIRPERIKLQPKGEPGIDESNALSCKLQLSVYKGNYYDLEVDTAIGALVSRQTDALSNEKHCDLAVWRPQDCVVGPVDQGGEE